jgi:hypothetical protein
VVQGAAGRDLDKSEKQAIKSQLKAKQDGLRGDIANLGGTVLADYQLRTTASRFGSTGASSVTSRNSPV